MAEGSAARRQRLRRQAARLALVARVTVGVALAVGVGSAAGGGKAAEARGAGAESPAQAPDPALEARVMRLAEELRCLVCQNESLAGSQSALAVDLRGQIREQFAQGRTPQQVTDFMVERFGEFVRYRPAFSAVTLPLWLGPFALLALAVGGLAAALRRQRRGTGEPLGEAQARQADELLGSAGIARAPR